MAQENLKKDEQSFDAAQDELKSLKLKCEEYLNGWKRERADFINFKKNEVERVGQMAKFANEQVILDMIPILDNIYLAETHVPEEFGSASSPQAKNWLKGFSNIKNQLCDFLAKEGIEPIKTIGEKFDPNFHESVGEISPSEASAKGGEPGTIVEEVQRGYTMDGKIIRVAKVKISK